MASHTCVTSSPRRRRQALRPLRRSCIQIRNGIRARLPVSTQADLQFRCWSTLTSNLQTVNSSPSSLHAVSRSLESSSRSNDALVARWTSFQIFIGLLLFAGQEINDIERGSMVEFCFLQREFWFPFENINGN